MRIALAGWSCAGLRCPDVELSIAKKGSIPKITLIQMANGTGKTTTLNLIRAAMTGAAQEWSAEQVREIRSKQVESENGWFTLNLLVDDVPLQFTMDFDFASGTTAYRSSSRSLGGVKEGWHCPPNVKRFLSESFASLFVFDGEFADRLVSSKEAQAERVIDALCQLDLLDRVSIVAEDDWDRLSSQKSGTSQAAMTKARNAQVQLEKQKKLLTAALAKLKKSQESLSRETVELETRLEKKLSDNRNYQENVDRLSGEYLAAKDALNNSVSDLAVAIRRPHHLFCDLAHSLSDFRDSLDKARLPETSSRQFFIDLSKEAACVCGRPIDAKYKAIILSQAEKYLGDELAGAINSIKSAVGNAISDNSGDFSSLVSSMSSKREATDAAKTALEAFRSAAIISEDSDFQSSINRLNSNKAELERMLERIQAIERPPEPGDDVDTVCLASIEKQLAACKIKIANLTNTLQLRAQTDLLRNVCERAKNIARESIREGLRVECNKRLKRVLAANPLAISRIGKSLEIEGGQSKGSPGQNLGLGYTFLATALHRGAHVFPLIVDSPAGPLDDTVRREVGAMVPHLCKQFIAFMISTERQFFLPALEREAGEDAIKYYTLFRKSPATRALIKTLPKSGVVNGPLAVVVEGKSYFSAFKIEADYSGDE